MKKLTKSIGILLSVFLLVSVCSVAVPAVGAEEEEPAADPAPSATVLLGDGNGNGVIDIGDATMVQKYLAALITFEGNAQAAADADWDGSVSISDATELQTYLAEFSVASPVGKLVNAGQPAIRMVNHRGYNTVAPENTLPAFRLSKEMGFPTIETDVQRTADGTYVCLHEETINRTARHADGTELEETVKISDITYEQASTYDYGIWKSKAYAGTSLPTLEQAIQLCRSLGLEMYLELKADTIKTPEHVSEIVAMVAQNGMLAHCTWISFSSDLLRYVGDICPTARLGFLCNSVSNQIVTITQGLQTGANEVFINAAWYLVNDKGVAEAEAAGLPIEVWTVSMYADPIFSQVPSYVTGFTTNRDRII